MPTSLYYGGLYQAKITFKKAVLLYVVSWIIASLCLLTPVGHLLWSTLIQNVRTIWMRSHVLSVGLFLIVASIAVYISLLLLGMGKCAHIIHIGPVLLVYAIMCNRTCMYLITIHSYVIVYFSQVFFVVTFICIWFVYGPLFNLVCLTWRVFSVPDTLPLFPRYCTLAKLPAVSIKFVNWIAIFPFSFSKFCTDKSVFLVHM